MTEAVQIAAILTAGVPVTIVTSYICNYYFGEKNAKTRLEYKQRFREIEAREVSENHRHDEYMLITGAKW